MNRTILSSFSLLLVSFTANAQQCDTPVDTLVSWTHPTENTDGSSLPLSEISNTAIFYSDQVCTQAELESADMIVVDAPDNEVCIEDLPTGDWCFAGRTSNLEGIFSALSNVATKTIAVQPNPPSDMEVGEDRTVYSITTTRNNLALIPVGMSIDGAQCDPMQSVVDRNGVLANVVAREDVETWFNQFTMPELVFAQCVDSSGD